MFFPSVFFSVVLDAQKMPVSTSCEEQRNSDIQVNEITTSKPVLERKKKFPKTRDENQKIELQKSEASLFRIRKKFYRKLPSAVKPKKVRKVLKETNRDPLTQHSTVHEEGENAALKQHQKRKIYELLDTPESSPEKCKLQKLVASCEVPDMYEYRHQMTNVSKNDGEANSFLNKNDAAEENLLNAFYQQQSLGGSNNSIATLCNIGNSCYLNSVIYTLRFAPQFLHKLHHLVEDMRQVYTRIGQHKLKSSSLGRNVGGIHNQNGRSWSSKDLVSLNGTSNGLDPSLKTNRQVATEKLHELYQSLHRNESIDSIESFHAGTFLQAIQDVSSVFEGNQQQDAHELLMCILDSIRETCSTLIRAIKENPEIMNQNVPSGDTAELTSPPQSNVHSSQSLKSIFSRKIRRKDTMKNNGGISSPIKENVSDSPNGEEEPPAGAKVNAEAAAVDNNEKVNEAIKRLGLDFFCKDFEGITLFTTKCLTCETVTEQKETMVDIAIPMSHDALAQPIDPQLFFQVSCREQLKFVTGA